MNNANAVDKNQFMRFDSRTGKYLTFPPAREGYGVEIRKAQEIIDRMPTGAVLLTTMYIRGVINMPDRIHPIMDIKVKSRMEQTRITDESCIMVINRKKHGMGKLEDRILSSGKRN
jgi:chemotaxis signal transduction protein